MGVQAYGHIYYFYAGLALIAKPNFPLIPRLEYIFQEKLYINDWFFRKTQQVFFHQKIKNIFLTEFVKYCILCPKEERFKKNSPRKYITFLRNFIWGLLMLI